MNHKMRLLDIDDLMILRHLGQGQNLASAAKTLGITQSAVTQRLRKLEDVFFPNIVQRKGRVSELTNQGQFLCHKISLALGTLESISLDIDADEFEDNHSVGMREEAYIA